MIVCHEWPRLRFSINSRLCRRPLTAFRACASEQREKPDITAWLSVSATPRVHLSAASASKQAPLAERSLRSRLPDQERVMVSRFRDRSSNSSEHDFLVLRLMTRDGLRRNVAADVNLLAWYSY